MYLDGGWKANYLIHRYPRWGRKWVCSGLSLGVHPEFSSYLHPWYVAEISCQRSRLWLRGWVRNIYIHSWSNIMVCCSNMVNTLFLGWLLFFPFCFAIAGSFKIGDDAHDHAWSTSRHANICCFRSHLISFYIFAQVEVSPSGAAGNSAMHLAVENCIKSSLMMSWVKRFESILGGCCEPTKRVGITCGSDAVNSLQCHWNDGNWTGDEWGNKFKLAQLFRWVD